MAEWIELVFGTNCLCLVLRCVVREFGNLQKQVAAWLGGSELVLINKVTVRPTGFVLGLSLGVQIAY